MSAGQVVSQAWHKVAGTIGEMSLSLERKQNVPKGQIVRWVTRLRAAADELEKLLLSELKFTE